MAQRIKIIRHIDDIRLKIQAGNLVTRLQKHVDGKVEMTATQVQAALGLLKKVVPDVSSQSIELNAKVESVVSAAPVTAEEWEKQYADEAVSRVEH